MRVFVHKRLLDYFRYLTFLYMSSRDVHHCTVVGQFGASVVTSNTHPSSSKSLIAQIGCDLARWEQTAQHSINVSLLCARPAAHTTTATGRVGAAVKLCKRQSHHLNTNSADAVRVDHRGGRAEGVCGRKQDLLMALISHSITSNPPLPLSSPSGLGIEHFRALGLTW